MYLGLVVILFQVLFGVHAVKTGRTHPWLWIIVFVPVVGCLIYLFAVYLPSSDGAGPARRVRTGPSPATNLKQLKDGLARSDTMNNRLLLAQGYLDKGLFAEAEELAEQSLRGPLKNDRRMLFVLANAHYRNAKFDDAVLVLRTLGGLDPLFRPVERSFLLAQALEEAGKLDEAKAEYESVLDRRPGEEAQARYRVLLEKMGESDLAR